MATITTSNCFVTLVEATAYFDESYHKKATWDALTEDQQSQLLIEATTILYNHIEWNYTVEIDDPKDCQKLATYEQAYHLHGADRQAEAEDKGVKNIKVGEIEIEKDKADRQRMIPGYVANLVRDYTISVPGGINIVLERA